MTRQTVAFLTVLFASTALHAQAVAPGSQDYRAMLEAVQAAQAGANQPGDEELTCEELEQQVSAIAQDPAFQSSIQAGGVQAEKDMAAIQAAESEVAGKAAATAVASVVPGAAMGHVAASAAENQAKQAQAAERQQSRMSQGQEMMAFAPQLMRGERLLQLAAAKDCKFASSMNAGAAAESATPDEDAAR